MLCKDPADNASARLAKDSSQGTLMVDVRRSKALGLAEFAMAPATLWRLSHSS